MGDGTKLVTERRPPARRVSRRQPDAPDRRPALRIPRTAAFHPAPPVFSCVAMISLNDELQRRLAAIREQDLYRELRRLDSPQGPRIEIAGRTLLNFSANDYLGLASHPALKEAAR